MAGALRKTMLYLGLADDQGDDEYVDEYDDYDDVEAPVRERDRDRDRDRTRDRDRDDYRAEVTPLRRGAREAAGASDLRRITTIHPRTYSDARVIGEAFRAGTPVIMNLTDMNDGDAKRLVDFAGGLIFGLHGAIERVTSKVFLLSPEHVEITGEELASTPRQKGAARFYDHG
jgi:cell division inhibitor SepF